jgi:TonB family protein
MVCHYRDNRLDGPYREWYASGQQKISQVYRNEVLDGPYTSWRRDGTLKVQTFYAEGNKNGGFVSYYENGIMARNDLYEDDILLEGQCYTPEGEPTAYFPYIEMPQFPQGRTGLLRFIREELNYPEDARRRRYEGSVILLFTVDEEGFVKDPRVVNGDIQAFNTEAVRIASVMPPWTPGKVDGIPSPMQVTLPIEFSLR